MITSLKSSSTKYVAAACLLFASGASFAQRGFDFGLKGTYQASAMLNQTDQDAGPELDFKNKMGFGAGASIGYTFTKHIGAEIGILYSKQGWSYTGESGRIATSTNGILIICDEFQGLAFYNTIPFSSKYTADISLTYLKIPLLFRYTGNSANRTYFSGFIGPQLNMLSSAVTKVNGTTTSFAAYGIKNEDMYKKQTLSGVLGLGFGVRLPANLTVALHLRLDYGLNDAEDKSKNGTMLGINYNMYDPKRATTNNATAGLMLSVNYKLKMGKKK